MAEATESPSGYFNQSFTVEFTISGSLDGTTLVPTELQAPSENDDPQQLYRVDVVGNAGLFDVDYLVTEFNRRGAVGSRFVAMIWIVSPIAGSPGASLAVVDAVDGPILVQETVDSLAGLTRYYRRIPNGVLVPQGSLLSISGFTNPGTDTIKVRLTIQFINDLIEIQSALCCEGGGSTPSEEAPMQELLLDVHNIAMQNLSPIEGQENVTVPTGFNAADRSFNAVSGNVFLVYEDPAETDVAAVWQLSLPAEYHGNGLELIIEVGGDGSAQGDVEFYARIERQNVGYVGTAPSFGPEIDMTTTVSGTLVFIQTNATIVGADLDGLVAGEAFRLLIARRVGDTYTGSAVFFRGRIREVP